ncbi:hypothetical protein [Nocardia sp. NPDC058666]|uniref:hypothetical protein n=1 Tax=Nocardia sp. NPDC058666 TaxID=3346587 RepID=UPI003649CBDF
MTDNRDHLDTPPPLDLAVGVTCGTCQQSATFHVNEDRFIAWGERRLAIQDAFAYLSAPDRAFIKSRICLSCWTDLPGARPGR